MRDEIVAEIRRIREEHAAEFNFDVRAIAAYYQEREKHSTHPIVCFGPCRRKAAPASRAGEGEAPKDEGPEKT